MNKSGLQNEEFLQKIQREGSNALSSRNSFGINVFSGSVMTDGVVSGKLTKTKYNPEELVKSVDTNIFELIPPPIPPEPDVVPRPIYNEALVVIADLTLEVERLNVTASNLQALVEDLRITTQSLRVELDSKDLVVASVENQNQQSVLQVQSTIVDLQTSIQKATSEAIQRASLFARNQTLSEQVLSLTERLEGKQAETEAGAVASGTLFTVNALPKDQERAAVKGRRPQDIYADKVTDRGGGFLNTNPNTSLPTKIINGKELNFFNASDNPITISFKRLEKATFLTQPQSFTLQSKERKLVKLTAVTQNPSNFSQYNSKKTKDDGEYTGTLEVTGVSTTGVKEVVSLSTNLEKYS
jgi:hypothetical protein